MTVRILHVTAPGMVGGLERVVDALVRATRDRGHDVSVFASTSTADAPPFVSGLRAAGVPVRHEVVSARAYVRELRAIRRVLAETGADVVHTHGFRSDVLGLLAAHRADRPAVTTVHGFTGGGTAVQLYERVQMGALRRFDAVVAVSRPMAERFAALGFDPGRLHTVPNALASRPGLDRAEARRALDLPAGPLVAWVGRFGTEKGPDLFADAIARLDGVTGVMIGDGPDRAPVADRARVAGCAERLLLPGLVPDADRVLRAFDVLVLSSRTEGTPMILLEAMAAGVPVVTTAVGGIPDVVTEAEAILTDVDAGSIADGIGRALADPAAAAERAARAKRRFDEGYGLGPWIDRYEAVYGAVTGGQR